MSDPQFDVRYRLTPPERVSPGVRKRSRAVAHQQTVLQQDLTHRPAGMDWFEEALARPAGDWDGPVVGVYCGMVPPELVRAAGARPVRLDCGNAALVPTGDEVFSGEICPLAKSSLAMLLDPESVARRAAALVLPASCDAKTKLGEVLADFAPTFTLALPREQDAGRHAAAMAEELDRLAGFLAEHLPQRPKRRDLLREIERSREQTRLVRALQAARIDAPGAVSIRDFHLIVQAALAGADPEEWERRTRAVLAGAEGYTENRARLRPRLILTGAPMLWPNFKALNLIEESGADIVADTLCSGAQSLFDPVVVDERGWTALLRALALRYVFASPCPCFVSQATRMSRVLDLVRDARAVGVVNYGLRLCQLFDFEAYRLQRVLKEHRIPFLNLRTDYSLEDTEQLRVRLEAFLETVEDAP